MVVYSVVLRCPRLRENMLCLRYLMKRIYRQSADSSMHHPRKARRKKADPRSQIPLDPIEFQWILMNSNEWIQVSMRSY